VKLLVEINMITKEKAIDNVSDLMIDLGTYFSVTDNSKDISDTVYGFGKYRTGKYWFVEFSDYNRSLTTGGSSTLYVVDKRTGKCVAAFDIHGE
jgi:hypothetical protein